MKSNHVIEQTPPHNIEAEMSILGAMIIENNCIEKLHRKLNKNWFYKTEHQELFQTIIDLSKAGKAVDLVILREELKNRSLLEKIGTEAYLIELCEVVPHTENAEYYADIVMEKAMIRSLIEHTVKLQEAAYAGDKETLSRILADNPASQLHDIYSTCEAVKVKPSTMEDMLNYPTPEYLIEPIIYRETSNLLTSYFGIGKSLLAMSIAHALVTQQLLWGYFPIKQKGSVLIVDEENPGCFLKDRLVKMGFTKDMPLHFLHFQSIKLDDQECFMYLVRVIQDLKPTLVIFDALIRLHRSDEKDNTEMAYVMGKIREIVNLTGVTVLTIHHERKGQGDKKERARGAGDIVGAVDHQLCLESIGNGVLMLSSGKTRVAPLTPIKLKLEEEGECLTIKYMGQADTETEEIIREVIEILDESCLGVEEVKKALYERGYDVGVNKLRTILKSATGKELAVDSGEKRKLFYKVNPCFTASRGIYMPLSSEAEKGDDDPPKSFISETNKVVEQEETNCKIINLKEVTL
ncbi:MAG: hypothetical protein E3K40_10475 [Candidatus Brocadia sp.]|nr:hypothetical protein [Candidatus Brocadia sp.]